MAVVALDFNRPIREADIGRSVQPPVPELTLSDRGARRSFCGSGGTHSALPQLH
jgi:hypothetical protein